MNSSTGEHVGSREKNLREDVSGCVVGATTPSFGRRAWSEANDLAWWNLRLQGDMANAEVLA
jgi:hypothetical protein